MLTFDRVEFEKTKIVNTNIHSNSTLSTFINIYTRKPKTIPMATKKWFGNSNNYSASGNTQLKRTNSTGDSWNMAQIPVAYTSVQKQDVHEALRRVRSSGYIVPPKVSNYHPLF